MFANYRIKYKIKVKGIIKKCVCMSYYITQTWCRNNTIVCGHGVLVKLL